ncbi:MAG TPA: hypothetical protein VK518_23695 [Puia sp.]|nr:hypothetical protein [Puia sp.]
MHTKTILLIPLLATGLATFAQTSGDTIANKTWYKKINQSFGLIATGQGEAANLANYGSFDPVNGVFKLNIFGPIGSTDTRRAAFFSVDAGGNIEGDNTGVLFNNSKFNSGLNVTGKLHLPLFAFLDISQNEADSISAGITKLRREMEMQQLQARQQFDSTHLSIQYINDAAHLRAIGRKLQGARGSISGLQTALTTSKDSLEILKITDSLLSLFKQEASLQTDSAKVGQEMAANKALLGDLLTRLNNINQAVFRSTAAFNKRRDSLEMTIDIKGSSFLWLTLTGGLNRKKYYSFADSLSFSNQFSSQKYTSYAYGIEFNYIGYSSQKNNPVAGKMPHVHVGNLGISRVRNNNTGDFSTVELTDAQKYSAGDSTHNIATKYNVYTDPITEYKAWKVYLNYYYVFGKKRNFALHVFPDVEFRDNRKNPFNSGAGFIFSLNNKKDKTLFNLEVYAKLIDIGKALDEDEVRFINRNEVGVHMGIPFNFPTFK